MSADVHQIVYGTLTFTDDDILDGELYEVLAPLSDALEIGTFQVRLHVTDPETGAALTAFRRNDQLQYFHRGVLRGTYYMEQVRRTGTYTYEITANDALALLEQSSHLGGIYAGETAGELIGSICTIPCQVQTRFAGVKLYGWLPIASRRDNLAQVLFALGAHAKVDRTGTLRIEALWDAPSAYLPDTRIFLGDRVNYETKVTRVSVREHQYIPGEEEVDLFTGAAREGDRIPFSQPVHSLTAEGFGILEQGANYAVVSAGSGTLRGKTYVHITRDVEERVTAAEVDNVVEVTEATLVGLTNASAVAQRLAGYYQWTQTLEHQVLTAGEQPGDVVSFVHPYGGAAVGCIREATVSLGGRLVARERITVGYTPPSGDQTQMLTQRVVLTGAGSWTPPEGASEEAQVVLIDGGEEGAAGSDGESGGGLTGGSDQETRSVAVSRPSSGTSSGTATANASASSRGSNSAGAGGKGGTGGGPGRVLRTSVRLEAGTPIAYACGAARKHGEGHTLTTFGAVTSAQGSTMEQGYTDPVTGEIFAAPGRDGADGGAGGGNGEAGAAVAGVPGGAAAEGGSTTRSDRDSQSSVQWWADYTLEAQFQIDGGGGGGAGGNSGPNLGSPGQDASLNGAVSASVSAASRTGTATCPAVNGGTGGDGAAGSAAQRPGSGGDGGGGGGGAGAPGKGTVSCTSQVTGTVRSNASSASQNFSVTAYAHTKSASSAAGRAGPGGLGAEGCVIVYYALPKQTRSGWAKEKNGRFRLDRTSRRCIV